MSVYKVILNNKVSIVLRQRVNRIRYSAIDAVHRNKEYDFNPAKMFWWNKMNNFGDFVTPYLYKKITNSDPIHTLPDNSSTETVIIGAGSVINWSTANSIIWGSGIMSRFLCMQKPLDIKAVRGPLSRARMLELGFDCPSVYGDPAILLPKFYKSVVEKKYSVGVVPHYVDYKRAMALFADKDVLVIDVLRDLEEVVDDINRCDVIVSSSLHGCIVSNAYGIPSAWCHFSQDVAGDNTKYLDYYQSMGIDGSVAPINLKDGGSVEYLQAIVSRFPQPEYPLVDEQKLLESCPFYMP